MCDRERERVHARMCLRVCVELSECGGNFEMSVGSPWRFEARGQRHQAQSSEGRQEVRSGQGG